MKYKNMYKAKLLTMDQALALVKSNDHIIAAIAGSEPQGLLGNLHTIADRVENVVVSTCLPMQNYPFFARPEMHGRFINEGWFYSPIMRKAHPHKTVSFVPNHLHLAINKRVAWHKANIFMGTCTPPDAHGFVSLGLGAGLEADMIEQADLIILEVNENLPRLFGDTSVHISNIHHFVENTIPVPQLPMGNFDEKDRRIGEYIAELVEDGATIQLGFGGIPNAAAHGLMNKKDLGVHTEMIVDSMVDLYEAGVITNNRKTLHRGKMVATFTLGTQKLYDFIDNNPGVMFLRGSYTNDPYVIGQNYKMVSINTTLEIDLTGQCCSESIGHMQFSGTGGQADTAIGAQMSLGGKSIIALYSTAKDDTISKITPLLTHGAAVSLSRNDVDYVVTEYGIAELRGTSLRERVKRLSKIAHPQFRPWLQEEAEKMQLW